jgi:hypothetical protein
MRLPYKKSIQLIEKNDSAFDAKQATYQKKKEKRAQRSRATLKAPL